MHVLEQDYASGVLRSQQPPCLSLYQTTHRNHPANKQDPIRFRNLIKSLEDTLLETQPKRDVHDLLEPFRALGADELFWQHNRDGLAVLGARGFFRVYRVQRQVPELAVAADTFHTKPLLRVLQSADRYQVLGLSRQRIRLFEGNRDVLDEIEPADGVPRTVTDALGDELTEPHQSARTFSAGPGGAAAHHGQGGRKDEVDLDAERFFRAVDRAVTEHHSRPSGLPLLLAALPEHHAMFREVSRNAALMPAGLEINPDALDAEGLRERAWHVIQPQYLQRLADLVEEFGAARAKNRGTDDLAKAAEAAVAGRVRTLLIDADRHISGLLDAAAGTVELREDHPAGTDDVLDDLGELVLSKGGSVVIVPAQRMPTRTGIAATFAY